MHKEKEELDLVQIFSLKLRCIRKIQQSSLYSPQYLSIALKREVKYPFMHHGILLGFGTGEAHETC